MEIPHLQTFCKAAELLNFTAAAEALFLTQAAVSQRIRALEQDLGVDLFDRQSGRVHLTHHGRVLYDYARRIAALEDETRAALGKPMPQLAGDLRLGASTVPAEHLLPDLLEEFNKRFPKVVVHAGVGDSDAILRDLEEGKVSLALVGKPGPAAWADSKPFARDQVVLVVAPGHPLAKKAKVRLEDVKREPVILREPGSGTRACLEDALRRHDLTVGDLQVRMALGSNEAIKEAVLRGSVAFLSIFAVRQDLDSGRLVSPEVADLEASRDLYIVTDRRRVLPPPARAFLELVEHETSAERRTTT